MSVGFAQVVTGLSRLAIGVRASKRRRRLAHIAACAFPKSIPDKVCARYPHRR